MSELGDKIRVLKAAMDTSTTMLDPAHFARIRTMDPVELEQRRQDWLASMMEDDRDE